MPDGDPGPFEPPTVEVPRPVPLPSVRAVLRTDAPARTGLALPLVFWAVHVGMTLVWGLPFFDGAIALPLCATGIGLGIAGLRWGKLAMLFARGERIEGTVDDTFFHRSRGRIWVAYLYQGEARTSWAPLHQTDRVSKLDKGDKVELVVDPHDPDSAYIQALYVDAAG